MLGMQRGRPRSGPQCVSEFMDRQCMYDLMLCAHTLGRVLLHVCCVLHSEAICTVS